MGRWAKLRQLSGEEFGLLLRAALMLPVMVLGLRLIGFNRMRALLGRRCLGVSQLPAEEEARLAATAARMVGVAARHGLLGATCLPRSLTLWRILRKRGIESDLMIGVRTVGGKLDAHAWVEYRGVPLAEAGDIREHYAAFPHDSILIGER